MLFRSPTAIDISGLSSPTFLSIEAGNEHTCGITTDGTAYCWGANGGEDGRLGNDSTEDSLTPVAVDTTGLSSSTFKSISAGLNSSCGITNDGTGYCWGRGWRGRLGTGDGITSYKKPEAIDITNLSSPSGAFQSISAYNEHTCGLATEIGRAHV